MKVYQHIFEYTPDALLLVDQAGRITLANTQAETLFGYDRSELIGQPVEMLVPHHVAARHVGHRDAFMAESRSRQMGAAVELFARRKDGSELAVDIMLSPMHIDGHHFTLCVARDITERKAADDKLRQQTAELQKLHVKLKELANQDSLTGLLNRRAFHEHAAQMLKTARRRKESAALLMIDFDYFKEVNDRFGHAEGDHVLKMVAAALKATARENDIVARYGGEEFVVAVLGANEAESIAAAERLRLAIAAIRNTKSNITASIGVTTCTPHMQKLEVSLILEELLTQADRALYAAKHNGRNQVCHANGLAQADFLQ
jgi:diguanylate cyclase (GGDEF)-like protein/PAS domain S-box-containing protein